MKRNADKKTNAKKKAASEKKTSSKKISRPSIDRKKKQTPLSVKSLMEKNEKEKSNRGKISHKDRASKEKKKPSKHGEILVKQKSKSTNPPKPILNSKFEGLIHALHAALILERSSVEKKKLQKVLQIDAKELAKLVVSFNKQEKKRGSHVIIESLEDNYRLGVSPETNAPFIKYYLKKKKQLSKPALETLSIIAYLQPISTSDIEVIRATNSKTPINSLREQGLIKGKRDGLGPGKPILYSTTEVFLTFFSLKSLNDLPELEEIKNYPFLDT